MAPSTRSITATWWRPARWPSRFDLDEVVFVPTGQPWQKADRQVSAAEDRYLMTVIATASNPRFTVSRVDIDRPGMTYTVDTLRDIRAERGDDVDLYFITGADALAQILTWRDVETAVRTGPLRRLYPARGRAGSPTSPSCRRTGSP